MLTRSPAAKFAISKFYEDFNDIDIFIEDTAHGYTKIFSILLTRCLSKNISLDRVFPLGGRDKVIEAARKSLIKENSRSSAYIVDGDLYLLCGEPNELPPNVICLKKYCIENYLFDIEAITQVFFEENADSSYQEIYHAMSFDEWIKNNQHALKKLFIWFAVSHKLMSGIKTTSRGHSSICEHGNVSPVKVDLICADIESKLTADFDKETVKKTYNSISDSVDGNICFVSHYVSAKDFLLPLFLIKAKSATGSKSSNLNIKIRLANICNTEEISKLVHSISVINNRPELLP
ncbi:DUF4435 domain-containing protein [Aeromonas hydrophila]|nr:DUF4435 domain-containing protein [Aeromonas hydrophila]